MSATGRALSRETVFAEVLPLIEAGFAVHVLRAQSKAPVEAKWSESPVHTAESFKEAYRTGANVGLRLGTPSHTGSGYAHVVDLDIRKPESADEAWAAMRAMWPGVDKFPMVISGSGGESRHVYCFCSQAFRSRKLAKSEGFEMVFDKRLGRDVKKNDWEMELFGTGKQVAIPPSIHPDTGKAYVWKPGVGIDPEDLDLGLGPTVSPSLVASWGAQGETASGGGDDEDDDEGTFGIFEHALRFAPMGLTQDEIDGTLAKLPEDWVEDRDRWLEVGQALHHEYKGSVEGFTVWCEWSEQSEKFNLKDSRSVWRSFRNRTRKPVRMASLHPRGRARTRSPPRTRGWSTTRTTAFPDARQGDVAMTTASLPISPTCSTARPLSRPTICRTSSARPWGRAAKARSKSLAGTRP